MGLHKATEYGLNTPEYGLNISAASLPQEKQHLIKSP